MAENEFKTPADYLGESYPHRPTSEILNECFPEAERKGNAARICNLLPDAPDTLVEERFYMNLIKDELWLEFGIADIRTATSAQIAHCGKIIADLDNLKNEKP